MTISLDDDIFLLLSSGRLEIEIKNCVLFFFQLTKMVSQGLIVTVVLLSLSSFNVALECYQSSPGTGVSFTNALSCADGVNQCVVWRVDGRTDEFAIGGVCVNPQIASYCGKVIKSPRQSQPYHVCCCEGNKCNGIDLALTCDNSVEYQLSFAQ